MLGFASGSGNPRAEAGTLFVKSVGFTPRRPEKLTRWSQEWARERLANGVNPRLSRGLDSEAVVVPGAGGWVFRF